MSRMIEEIDLQLLNQSKAVSRPLSVRSFNVEEDFQPLGPQGGVGTGYSVRAQWGFNSFTKEPNQLHHLREEARRELIYAIYGDFIEDLLLLKREVMDLCSYQDREVLERIERMIKMATGT